MKYLDELGEQRASTLIFAILTAAQGRTTLDPLLSELLLFRESKASAEVAESLRAAIETRDHEARWGAIANLGLALTWETSGDSSNARIAFERALSLAAIDE